MTAAMPPLAPLLMIASGSVHAIVNAIVKGGRDKMAGRALTDGSSAVILLPATLLVPLPAGAWGWIVASGVIHGFYLWALLDHGPQGTRDSRPDRRGARHPGGRRADPHRLRA